MKFNLEKETEYEMVYPSPFGGEERDNLVFKSFKNHPNNPKFSEYIFTCPETGKTVEFTEKEIIDFEFNRVN